MAEYSMKQRIIGAVVLISLAVIFVPMLLDGSRQYDRVIVKTNIPPKPKGFNSKIVPLELEKPASGSTQTSKAPLVPTVTPSIKPLKQVAPAVTKKTATVKTVKKVTKETENKATVKTVPKPAASKPSVKTVKKEAPKQVSKPVEEDASAVTAIDKSTQLARAEPVISGQPLTATTPTSAGAPITDSSGKSPEVGVSAWAVQVGSFGQEANANALRDRLRKQGYASFVERIYGKSAVSYRVRVGPELDKKKADTLRDKLASREKLKGIVVRYP